MLHEISRIPQPRALDTPAADHIDRSMDVLQYATAFLAILVAILLAVIH